jgi:SAM-dependent methyltransferase
MAEEEMIDWRGERTERWLRQAAGLERQLLPVSDVLFAAADLQPGEHVLDVGCGTAPTTRRAARAVAPGGSATGLDVSDEMLAAARAASSEADGDLRWDEADPVTWTPDRSFDVVISRFGVMFFSDPAAAFATLARAAAPDGRLAMAIWSRRDASPLFEVPVQAALSVMDAPPELPLDMGPFSLHDPARTTPLLEAAGWRDIGWEEHDLPMLFAGGVDPEQAALEALGFGPTSVVLDGADDALRERACAAMAAALAEHVDGDGHVLLDGRVVLVTALRS